MQPQPYHKSITSTSTSWPRTNFSIQHTKRITSAVGRPDAIEFFGINTVTFTSCKSPSYVQTESTPPTSTSPSQGSPTARTGPAQGSLTTTSPPQGSQTASTGPSQGSLTTTTPPQGSPTASTGPSQGSLTTTSPCQGSASATSTPTGFFLIPLLSYRSLIPSGSKQPIMAPSAPPRLPAPDLNKLQDKFNMPSRPDPVPDASPTRGPSQNFDQEKSKSL